MKKKRLDPDVLAKENAAKKKKRLEIETEFKILKSLIPKVANKQTFNEVGS